MTKFFKKSQKPYFGAILGPLCPNLGKNEFSWKRWLCQFLDIPIMYHHAKKSEKTNEKNAELKDGQTDRWTDRQTGNGDFTGPSVGKGSNKLYINYISSI